jgi:hypothetical protein
MPDRTGIYRTRFSQCRRLILVLALTVLTSVPNQAERGIRRERIAPGCLLISISDTARELAAYALHIDLHVPQIEIRPVRADETSSGLETVPSMARRIGRSGERVLGAVNADYFTARGPVGLFVLGGKLIKTGRGWSGLGFTGKQQPFIERFEARLALRHPDGSSWQIHTLNVPPGRRPSALFTTDFRGAIPAGEWGGTWFLSSDSQSVPFSGQADVRVVSRASRVSVPRIPEDRLVLVASPYPESERHFFSPGTRLELEARSVPEGHVAHHAVSGGPRLLREGRVSVEREEEGQREGFDSERHPRTAAGFTRDGRYLVLLVVDGRQPGHSRGIDLYDLAALLLEFECYEALNLDGGGSSTLVVEDRVANRPSDVTGPRPVANALLVLYREDLKLDFDPDDF